MLVGDTSLPLGEHRDRVRTRAGKRALELRSARRGFTGDECTKGRLGLHEIGVHRVHASQRALQEECRHGGDEAACEPACGERELAGMVVPQCEGQPGGHGRPELENRERDERRSRQEAQHGTGKCERGDTDAGGEDDVEDARQHHRPMVRGQPDRASSSAPASAGSAAARS